MKKIVFTGGGSGGHVTLNANLIPLFLQAGWQVGYIGSKTGIENEIIRKISGVRYYAIETGKLRRYFSWQNFKDMLHIPVGVFQAWRILKEEKPDVIFSKGGFVSFPVVLAGYLSGCKHIYMHESDVTPGLANKMSLPFVTRFYTTFPDTVQYVKNQQKVQYIGPVLSDRLLHGSREKAMQFCRFERSYPTVMFVGGSLGAQSINRAVYETIDALLQKYNVIHICGKGQMSQIVRPNYAQFEFVDTEFKDLMALADMVVSRSGSNAIFEFLSKKKPMLLIPLSGKSSRGEQTLNAQSFEKHGFAKLLKDDDLQANATILLSQIDSVYEMRSTMIEHMENSKMQQISAQQLFDNIVHE